MKIEREALIVHFKSPKVIRKLSHYGNLKYVSKKQFYAYLFVDANNCDKIVKELKDLYHVSSVEKSLIDLSKFSFEG